MSHGTIINRLLLYYILPKRYKENNSMVDSEQTRAAFADLIDKPPLTDQLLSRPPFKFILDVVSATITKTGYLKDKFTKDELNPNRFTDKSTKMEFLDKLIEALNDDSLTTVKSAKIVAGKEPEQTNLLLRKLALSARSYKEENNNTKQMKQISSNSKEKSSSKRDKSKESKSGDKERKTHREEGKKSTKEKKESGRSGKKSKSKEKDHNSNIVEIASENLIENAPKLTESSSNIDEGFGEASITQVDSPTNIDDSLSPVKTDDSGLSELVESPRPPPPEEREQMISGQTVHFCTYLRNYRWKFYRKRYKRLLVLPTLCLAYLILHKLSNLLSQLDDEVRDVRETLTAVKARIASNNDKIRLMLSGM
uniref:MIP-T3 domain-containing protein n=1 Tax=Heterorhabditis bacteriophora TaxID=37862 RepID=A0A1I7XER9_HETBA